MRILGYVPLDAFVASIAACDICINLRRPTAGETSGSLLRAMALGKPAIVSEIGAFLDLPKDVAVRIPVDDREEDWLFEYMNVLLNDPGLAKAVGERGREYVARECAWPKVASEYVAFLKQCAAVNPKGESPGSLALAQPRVGAFGASSEEIEEYIMGFSHASPQMEEYVLLHRKRLAHTVGDHASGRGWRPHPGIGLLSAPDSGAAQISGLWRDTGSLLWPCREHRLPSHNFDRR